MKNLLLYFFACIIWTATVPFFASPAKDEHTPEPPGIINALALKDSDGEINELTLDEYVAGAMLSELPSASGRQALRALAVALRSRIVYLTDLLPESEVTRSGLPVLTAGAEGVPAMITLDALKELSGEEEAIKRFAAVNEAVYATSGEIITYGGKAAMALYHISSPARTESYENLFGTPVPYLSSVANIDESSFAHYKKEVFYSYESLKALLTAAGIDSDPAPGRAAYIKSNSSGRCEFVVIDKAEVPGSVFAKIAGLNSLYIELTAGETGCTFTSLGWGSGLGMSLYGARVLEDEGKDYNEILTFYFKDCVTEKRK